MHTFTVPVLMVPKKINFTAFTVQAAADLTARQRDLK